jgi:tyrosine-protein kinase Etk/Wzc
MQDERTLENGPAVDERTGMAAIIDAIVEYRMMVLLAVVSVVLMGALYILVTPSLYEASVLIKVEDSTGQPSRQDGNDLLNNISPGFDERSTAESEIQVIGSRLIVARAVDALRLEIEANPHYFGPIGQLVARRSDKLSTPGLFGMGGYAWGTESIALSNFSVPDMWFGENYTVTALGDRSYALTGPGLPEEGVRGDVGRVLRLDTAQGPITLFITKLNGNPGVRFDVVRYSRQQTVDRLQKNLQIKEQGSKSSVLKVSLQGPDARRATDTINEIGRQYEQWNAARKAVIAKNSLDYLQSQLPTMEKQVRDAEEAYNAYRNTHGLLDMNEEARLLLQRSAEGMTQVLELQRKRDALLATYAPTYPVVVALNAQIASTQRALDEMSHQIKTMPSEQQGAMRLERDVRVNTDLYTTLRSNIEQLKVIQAGKAGSAQLIDWADIPDRPVKPLKLLVMAVSLVLGALIGIGLAIARDYIFRGVTDSREIEARTGLGVFGMIPKSDEQERLNDKLKANSHENMLLASLCPRDPSVEALRIVRSALQFAMISARSNVVMMTGPLPGVGKSFISANLAALLASGGKRVLLIDGDLRKGRLHRYLGVEPGVGLADVIEGSIELDAAITRSVAPRLDLLQTGRYPNDPAELVMSHAFRQIIAKASTSYDIVLLDAPPVLVVSDAGIMAPVAGLVFLVAKFADTRVGELQESMKRLAQTGTKVNGVLLNSTNVHTMDYAMARRYGSRSYLAYDYHSGSK